MRQHLLAAATALALVPATAFAQDAAPAPADPALAPAVTAPAEPALTGIATAASLSAEELIGADIVDGSGTAVGEVRDLRLGDDGKTVTHVMVDVGGFLGIGTRTVAIEPATLTIAEGDGQELITTMTREQLEALPAYEKRDGVWQVAG